MNTLVEIEAAIDTLSAAQNEELLLFIAQRLRTERASLPEPRKFAKEQIASWVAEDEEDTRRFREGE